MEFRKVFDTIPEEFDRYRARYNRELFDAMIAKAQIRPDSRVLELGPGTGQATDPILAIGCDYHAIELGEHLAEKMHEKYDRFTNFHLVNDDFITHDFGNERYDVIYSAATIQWIPEEVAFSKTFSLLKPGGWLCMMYMSSEYKTPNPDLYEKIQAIYKEYFKPTQTYKQGGFCYANAVNYGYELDERQDFYGERRYTAKEYAAFCGTHCDHIVLPEPYKTRFFKGLEQVIRDNGNLVICRDNYVLLMARRPVE